MNSFQKIQKYYNDKQERIEIVENEYEDMYKWKQLYPYCMDCCKKFKSTFDKCLDHNHDTGFTRAILCRSCNVKRK